MAKTYTIEGMTCGGCVKSVTKAIERLGLQAEVDLDKGQATVEGEHTEAQVKQAVEDAGFDVVGEDD